MVKIQEAKTNLSRLVAAAERGEEIIIARGDSPVARLVPIRRTGKRELGFLRVSVPDAAFDPLTEADLLEWEGPDGLPT